MLHAAVQSYSLRILDQVLVASPAADELVNGKTALMLALKSGQRDMCVALAEHGASLWTQDDAGTPACFYGLNSAVIGWMIDQGVHADVKRRDQTTLVEQAATESNCCVKALLKTAPVTGRNLSIAIRTLCLDELDTMLSSATKAMVAEQDKTGRIPLHYACMSDLEDVVDQLLYLGSPVDTLDDELMTPLLYACKYGSEDSVDLLLRGGSDAN
jgi:hypothetical protein